MSAVLTAAVAAAAGLSFAACTVQTVRVGNAQRRADDAARTADQYETVLRDLVEHALPSALCGELTAAAPGGGAGSAARLQSAAYDLARTAQLRLVTLGRDVEEAQRIGAGWWQRATRLEDAVAAVVHGTADLGGGAGVQPAADGADAVVLAIVSDLRQQMLKALQAQREQISRSARGGIRDAVSEVLAQLIRAQEAAARAFDLAAGDSRTAVLEADHAVTIARHAVQRLLIIAGSWPGQQRADTPLVDVVEGAKARVGDFRRVRYLYQNSDTEVLVEGRLVEPLIVALAELLGNALAYSPAAVDVYVQPVERGVRITVDDDGLGMSPGQREAAERVLAGGGVLDPTAPSAGTKFGFAVVGRLAQVYGLRADASAPSPSGGVRAVLFVPGTLLISDPGPDLDPVYASRAREWAPGSAAVPAGRQTGSTASGLPRRVPARAPQPRSAPDFSGPAVPVPADDLADGLARLGQALAHSDAPTVLPPTSQEQR